MKIGTRGSTLAMIQTKSIADIIVKEMNIKTDIVVISTQGDRMVDRPFHDLEGRGYFTKEIEDALLRCEIDAAVHSFKDVPSESPEGLVIVAVTEREDPSDLLVIRSESYSAFNRSELTAESSYQPRWVDSGRDRRVDDRKMNIPLHSGAIIGTSAVRRQVQIKAIRPYLEVKDLRGNVPTRLHKLADGQYDAIFLATAGVNRLQIDLSEFKVFKFDPVFFIPSPGQGGLAVQMRENDPLFNRLRILLHHDATGQATSLERDVMARFGGGCGLPLGVYAKPVEENWEVYGFWGQDTNNPVWGAVSGKYADGLSEELYNKLTE
ncbi:MAG: hydroxymethylbilane synthase [Candidatus Hatepunaea meridiana]|nr:hydroxymethylbilane synthase [Candidatus Hatepunaea meridiana]